MICKSKLGRTIHFEGTNVINNYYFSTGDLCAAKFVDGQWYRAKVEKKNSKDEVAVLYIDYGNRANIPTAKCGSLPGAFVSLPAFAHEYSMALCLLCSDVSNNLESNDLGCGILMKIF